MADPSVGWCGRLSPCLRVQPWPPAVGAEPMECPLPTEPDPGIERLLALYSGGTEPLLDDDADASQSSSASEEILSNQDLTLDKAMIARDLLGEWHPPADGDGEPAAKRPCLAPPGSEEPVLPGSPPPRPPSPPAAPELAEEQSWRKPVNLGAEHQALLPPLRPAAGRRRARPAGDRLLWDPSRLAEHEVERYQRRLRPAVVSAASSAAGDAAVRGATHLPDHEQALQQLQACDHDVEEALRRVSADQLRPAGRLSHWPEEECDLFEQGLRLYGKDFHTIQRLKVRTRSVREIVHFYYLWKKTERHRQFLTQLDKRKYGPPDTCASEPVSRVLSAAASSLQILMAADPWEHGTWAAGAEPTDPRLAPPPPPPPPPAGMASLLSGCSQLLLP